MLASTNKGCAHTGKSGLIVVCRLERGPAEEGVGGGRGVSVQTTEEVRRREEHGGKQEWIDMGGRGSNGGPGS